MKNATLRRLLVVLATSAPGLGARHAAADVPAAMSFAGAPAALARLFQAPSARPEWFTPAFVAQVPIEKLKAAIEGVTSRFGAFRSVEGSGLDYDVHFERGIVHARVVLDHAGLIAALVM